MIAFAVLYECVRDCVCSSLTRAIISQRAVLIQLNHLVERYFYIIGMYTRGEGK